MRPKSPQLIHSTWKMSAVTSNVHDAGESVSQHRVGPVGDSMEYLHKPFGSVGWAPMPNGFDSSSLYFLECHFRNFE